MADDKIKAMAMEVAEQGLALVREIKGIKGAAFTDGYHKRVGDMIAAMNVTRSALQTILVQEALVLRASDLTGGEIRQLKSAQ